MTIVGVSSITAHSSAPTLIRGGTSNKTDFKHVLDNVRSGAKEASKDTYQELVKMQQSLLQGNAFSGKDLILYQIKSSQFNLKVELLSKIAEGALSTVRKFQTSQ